MTFNASDVSKAMEEHGWASLGYENNGYPFALLLDGRAVLAHKVDLSQLDEGATDVWIVIKVEGRHFRKTGYRQSHDGTYWDGAVTEVRPKQQTITVYDKI
jgi:hypothetical protein